MADPSKLITEELVTLLPRLRRFARGLTGNAEEADDLVQSACEKALSHLHQWHPSTRLDSWMYRIVRNAYLDSRRAGKIRRDYALRLVNARSTHALSVDGQRLVENRMTLDAVRRGLVILPEEQRSVLLLVCVEGCSYKEASEILRIPVGTVMSRLARARMALTDHVEGGKNLPVRRIAP